MLYSIIDIGSNTVKCAVYKVDCNKIKQINFYSNQLGIIGKIENGILPENTIDELVRTINQYINADDSTAYCFATESLRRVKHLDEVVATIKSKCNIEVELISGEDEAMLSFEGFCALSPKIKNGIMVDMGGGSTEILEFTNGKAVNLNSFKFGCLSLRRDYVNGKFPTEAETRAIANRVADDLKNYPWISRADRICLIGGTGTAIGKLAIELGFTTVPEFTKETFTSLFEYLFNIDDNKIKLLVKYIPARVETIIPGMCAYRKIIETVNAKTVFISSGGIRDGFLCRKLRG